MTKQETENKKAAMEMLKSNKEDVYRLAMLADKQGDNELAQAKLKAEIAHWENIDKAQAEHYKNEAKRLERENLTAIETSKGFLAIDKTGRVAPYLITDKDGKPFMPTPKQQTDPRAAEMQMLDRWTKSTPEQKEDIGAFLQARGKGPKEERDRQKELIDKEIVKALADPMNKLTGPQLREKIMSGLTGAQAGAGLPRFNTLEEARAAKKAGKIKAGDTIMTPTGPIVVK